MKGRPENSFLDQFSERFMDHVRQVCTFAKLVPGFKYLHHDDQVTLLKSCVFEVLLVRLAGLFENQVSFTSLSEPLVLPPNHVFVCVLPQMTTPHARGNKSNSLFTLLHLTATKQTNLNKFTLSSFAQCCCASLHNANA